MVKKCKIYCGKGSQGGPAPWNLIEKFSLGTRIFKFYKNCPGLAQGMVTLGID